MVTEEKDSSGSVQATIVNKIGPLVLSCLKKWERSLGSETVLKRLTGLRGRQRGAVLGWCRGTVWRTK